MPAQELDSRILVFGELTRPSKVTLEVGTDKPDSSIGFGARFMGEIASAHNFYYEIGGKLDSISYYSYNQNNLDLRGVKFNSSYWSIGAAYLAPLGPNVSLGFHLEGRGERLSAQGTVLDATATPLGQVDVVTTYLRPWFRLSLDGSFTMGKLRPFVGVDVSATPLKTAQTVVLVDPTVMDSRTLRSIAPTMGAGVYMGLHF